MKKILFIFSLVLLLAACSSKEGAGKYTITVNFPDASFNGKVAALTSYDTGDTVQQAKIDQQKAIFEGEVEDSYYSRLVVDGKRLGFVVEAGELTIDWDKHEVKGGVLNDRIAELEKNLTAMGDEFEKLSAKEGVTEEELAAKAADLEAKEGDAFFKLYEANKENGIGPWAYYNYLMCKGFNVAQLDSALATVPAGYKEMKRFKKAVSDAQQVEKTAEGKMFTDFTVQGDDGKTYKLSDYVGKGQVTLVDFWASWCGPCRRAIPDIKSLYEKYNGKGMSFLGVAVWDEPADTRGAIEELQIPWPVIVGNQKLEEPTNLYGIMGIPHIIVFGPDGTILSRGLDGKELIAKVDEIMAQKK